MKRTLVCLVLTCLVWSWTPPIALAEDKSSVPKRSPDPLGEPTWPNQPLSIAQLDANCSNLSERDPFAKGQCNFQFMVGYFPKTEVGPGGPLFDYLPVACRVGVMCNTPPDWGGCLRGNLEILLEVNYCRILKEFGTYITGPNLIFRYNFLQPDCVIVPYFQAGAGFAFTDAWKWPAPYQELIGQEMEFLLRVEVGARLMITECVSFDAEFGLQHISNATLAPRNGGVNNLGFALGFTYFFGKVK